MAPPQRFTGPHLDKVLGGVVAALVIYENRTETTEFVVDKMKGPGYSNLTLTNEQKEPFEDSIREHALFSLAYAGYVHAWEQYRRVFDLDTTAYAEGSIIFGLAQYGGPDGCLRFQIDYPDALVYEWKSSSRDYWFASTIRNTLAHGSYSYSACSGLATLSNTNTKSHKKNKKSFDMTLPSVALSRLVMNSLRNFIQNVGSIGGHDPLKQMLEYV